LLRDFLVAPPGGDELDDLDLARRQRRLGSALLELRLDVRRQRPPAGMYLTDDAGKVVSECSFSR